MIYLVAVSMFEQGTLIRNRIYVAFAWMLQMTHSYSYICLRMHNDVVWLQLRDRYYVTRTVTVTVQTRAISGGIRLSQSYTRTKLRLTLQY